MPKKSAPAGRPDKRSKKRVMVRPAVTPEPRSEAVANRPVVSAAPVRAAWAPVARTATRSSGLIKDVDYRYIYGDLRRIGLLAGSLFAVLIVLTFVLR